MGMDSKAHTSKGEFPAQITRTMENKRQQAFCLQWKDFESNICEGLKEISKEKEFFDVTLACEDNFQVQAHKVILGACSPFFRSILKKNPHPSPLIYLRGVKYGELNAVVRFMYQGEVNVAQDDLNAFLAVAEDLQVKGLTQKQQPGEKTQPNSLSKQTNTVSSNKQSGDRHAMEPHGAGYGGQQGLDNRDHDEDKRGGEGDRDVEYIDPYLPLALKTESPVVDVVSDSEYSPDRSHERKYAPPQERYNYQANYQNSSTAYQDMGGSVEMQTMICTSSTQPRQLTENIFVICVARKQETCMG